MARIDTYFDIIQGHQITDEEIYKSEGDIPIYTGGNDIKGYWDKAIVGEEDLPCISYPTKGNVSGNAYVQEKIFDANNTAVLIPKSEWRGKIDLQWFCFKLKHVFLSIATSNENVSYLNKELIESYEIDIPDLVEQRKELIPLIKLVALKRKLTEIIDKVDNLLSRSIFMDS
jgi:restriction endonuclease S subunit